MFANAKSDAIKDGTSMAITISSAGLPYGRGEGCTRTHYRGFGWVRFMQDTRADGSRKLTTGSLTVRIELMIEKDAAL